MSSSAQPALTNDPGLAALAARMLTTLQTVPFDGSLRHYRGYMFDVKDSSFTNAYASAIRDVPESLRAQYTWIQSFQGVSIPNELIADGSRDVVFAQICMPHNCPDHTVYAFFDPARKRAWGVVNVDKKGYSFGINSARDEALMVAVLGRSIAAYGNDASSFPLSGKALAIAKGSIIESEAVSDDLFAKLDHAMMQ